MSNSCDNANKKVSSFKDFFGIIMQREKNDNSVVPLTTNLVESVMPIVATSLFQLGISNDNQNEFVEEVAAFSTSDKFISDLSEKIGEPQKGETEDEFVDRASNIMRELLSKKFKI